MFGQWCLVDDPAFGAPDLWVCEGVVGVDVVGVVDCVVVAAPLVVLGAAAAPAMPAAAPAVASAPATIVAPSILDTVIGWTSWVG
jgi:hypothetical protein